MLAGTAGKLVYDYPDHGGRAAYHAAETWRSTGARPVRICGSGGRKRVLSCAGCSDIQIDRIFEKVADGTLDDTARMLLGLAPFNGVLDEIDEETRRAIFEDIRGVLAGFEISGRVLLDAPAWLVTARAM